MKYDWIDEFLLEKKGVTRDLKKEWNWVRDQYSDIIPGYYMNKVHWNSVNPDGEVPDELLKDMLDKSYDLVWKGFQ